MHVFNLPYNLSCRHVEKTKDALFSFCPDFCQDGNKSAYPWPGRFMNFRDDGVGRLFATDSEEEVRSSACGQLKRNLSRANEQARARLHL